MEKISKNMKNKTFFDSVKCAWRGMRYAFKTEKNFAIYVGIALFFLIVNLLLAVKREYYMAYILGVGGVFSAELVNTAIEHLSNFSSEEIHEEIKYTKDIAAAAVLFFGFAYFTIEALIIVFTVVS